MTSATRGRLTHFVVLGAFFASGAAGLVYEVMATRALGAAVGGTALASQLVFSVFFAGLTIGAWGSQRWMALFKNAVVAFGLLELLLAATEIASLFLCQAHMPKAAAFIDGGLSPSSALFALGLTAIICLPVTIVMGATYPAVSTSLAQLRDLRGTDDSSEALLSQAYGINTLGAVLGALTSSWVLLALFGMWGTWAAGAGISASAAAAVLWVSRGQIVHAPSATQRADTQASLCLGIAAAAAGFAGISMEIVAIRILAVCLSDTIYTFALAVAAFIVGAALASYAWHRWSSARTNWFQLTLLSAAPMAAFWLLTPRLGTLVATTISYTESTWATVASQEALVAFLIATPAAFASTIVFLAVAAYAGQESPGAGARFSALWNGIGCALAPVVSVMLVLPRFGIFAVGAIAVAALAVAAVAALPAQHRRSAWWISLSAPPLIVAGFWGLFPWYATADWKLIWKRQGASGVVSVEESPDGHRRLRTNNTFTEGGDLGRFSQVRQGLLPATFANNARNVLVMGVGSGSTLWAVAQALPTAKLEAAELMPEVIEALGMFGSLHGTLLNDPRLRIHIADARTFVSHAAALGQTFDLVVGDLFHATQAGVGALYSTDHFRNVARIITPGVGVYAQWVPLHEASPQETKVIIKSFLHVFPKALAFLGGWGLKTPLLCLVGADHDLRIDVEKLSAWLASDPIRATAAKASGFDKVEETLAFYVGQGPTLATFVRDSEQNTDNHPRIELRAPTNRSSDMSLRNLIEMTTLQQSPRQIVVPANESVTADSEKSQQALHAFVAGIAAWNSGKLDEADQQLSRALSLSPGADAISQSLTFLRKIRLGETAPSSP
jgi:spermidine synthase